MSMKRFAIQTAKILGVVLAILVAIAGGVQILNMRALAKSSDALNEFCGNLSVATSQTKVSELVQGDNMFRFTPTDVSAFISIHTCHCTVHFKGNKVFN